ncbi:hypothetical protein ACIBG8_48465 [Nonomuraea sp. NPDC050556]|uniref:hypothetical protein n=1 Tax=Nonomuraea sp. NPDC050556 TaxID=3364369 RepID=UPI0037B17857
MTDLLRDTLSEWAAEAHVPHDLADRALRRRVRIMPFFVVVAALLAAVAVAVPYVTSGKGPAPVSVTPDDVLADTQNVPPRNLIAAGRLAMSAYFTQSGKGLTWWLYDPRTGTYERTAWSWVDVAPGLRQAAVLDGNGARMGLLDMNTREVTWWASLERPAGSVAWSPDGTKLLLTTYRKSHRDGYYIVDVATREAVFRALPARAGNDNARQNLRWSVDGRLIAAPTAKFDPRWVYYTPEGVEQPAPADESVVDFQGVAPISPVSPDGSLVFETFKITDRRTGQVVGRTPGPQFLGWTDNSHFIGLGCVGACGSNKAGMVLISADGKETTPLSAAMDPERPDGIWFPVMTPR